MSLFVFASNVEIRVSSTRIPNGQSVRIKIVAEGNSVVFPDLSSIKCCSPENIKKTNKIETRYYNGKLVTKNKKILSFDIFPPKNIKVPAFEIRVDGKIYKTKPINIEVIDIKTASKINNDTVLLKMKSDKKSVYMGEPFVITVDAIETSGSNIVQLEYRPPEFNDFFAKPIGSEKRYRTGNAIVHELKYLLVPQKSGKLTISPSRIRVGVKDESAPGDPFGMFGVPLRWSSVRSNIITVDVKRTPEKVDLVGKYTISSKIDHAKVKANMPVNYTLTISGEGNLEDMDDPVFDIDGVTVYSDDAVVKSNFKNGKMHSVYTKKYVFISDTGFTIPSLVLKEFDYNDGKIRELSTKAYPIAVTGGNSKKMTSNKTAAKKSALRTTQKSRQTPRRSVSKGKDILLDTSYYAKKEYRQKIDRFMWYIPLAFFGGVILSFLLMRYFPLFKNGGGRLLGMNRTYKIDEALKILYPHMSEDSEVEDMVRQLYEIQNGNKAVTLDKKKMNRLAFKYDRRGKGKRD